MVAVNINAVKNLMSSRGGLILPGLSPIITAIAINYEPLFHKKA